MNISIVEYSGYCFTQADPTRFRVWFVHGTKSVILALFLFGQLLLKASAPREVTELGIVIEVSLLSSKASIPIEVTELGIVSEVN